MSQIEDLDAINVYIANSKPKTSKAVSLRDDWIAWFNDLGFYARNFDSNNYNIARNKKRAFDLANATTPAEVAAIKRVQKEGKTTEEMTGGASILTSKGFVEEPVPLIPEKYKVALAVGAGALAVAIIAKKTHLI